jgi:uncharacterized membrane protein YccC
MSAAIQLINQPITQAEPAEEQLSNVTSFELAPEQRLRRALGHISQLQAEVRALREELARAERSLSHKDMLLRNAVLREQELRASLVKRLF